MRQFALVYMMLCLSPFARGSVPIEWQFSLEGHSPLVGVAEDITTGEYYAAGGAPGGLRDPVVTIAHLNRFGVGDHFIPRLNNNGFLWEPKSMAVKGGKILVGIRASSIGADEFGNGLIIQMSASGAEDWGTEIQFPFHGPVSPTDILSLPDGVVLVAMTMALGG